MQHHIDDASASAKDKQITQLKNQIRLFGILQIVMPVLMLVMALSIPRSMPQVAPETKNAMIAILCVFAAMDFGLIRFMLLPATRKRLAALENGQ